MCYVSQKRLLKNELLYTSLEGSFFYKAIHVAHDKLHAILCSNELIYLEQLSTLACQTNVPFGCFQFSCIKNQFSILSAR